MRVERVLSVVGGSFMLWEMEVAVVTALSLGRSWMLDICSDASLLV